jgi:hypothetical protein
MERLLVSIDVVDGVVFLLSMQATIFIFWHLFLEILGLEFLCWLLSFIVDWFESSTQVSALP